MIPYEDLVSALTVWRERNGLPTGASDYLGEPPAPEPVSFAAYESRPGAAEEVVMADEWAVDEPAEEPFFEEPSFEEIPVEDPAIEDVFEDAEPGFSTDDLIATHADQGDAIAADLPVEQAYDPIGSTEDIWGPESASVDSSAIGDETYNEPLGDVPITDDYPALENESPPTADEDVNADEPALPGESTQINVEPAPGEDDFF